MYKNPTAGLNKQDITEVHGVAEELPEKTNIGTCIHIPARPAHKRILVRDSKRIMDLCEGCFGVMDRAECVDRVLS